MAAAQWGGHGGRGMGMGGFGGLGGGRMGIAGGRLGGLRDARMAMMGGGGFGSRQQMMGGYGAGAYRYTQDPYDAQQQGYYQQAHGNQNPNQMGGMGMGGYGGPVGLEALVGAILGTGVAGGQNPIKRIISQVSLILLVAVIFYHRISTIPFTPLVAGTLTSEDYRMSCI